MHAALRPRKYVAESQRMMRAANDAMSVSPPGKMPLGNRACDRIVHLWRSTLSGASVTFSFENTLNSCQLRSRLQSPTIWATVGPLAKQPASVGSAQSTHKRTTVEL